MLKARLHPQSESRGGCYINDVWPQGFDPEHLTRDASLNKLVIRRVPGARAVGRNGADLLGRDAVVTVVRERCGVDVRPVAVADWLGALWRAIRPEARRGWSTRWGPLSRPPSASGTPFLRALHRTGQRWRFLSDVMEVWRAGAPTSHFSY